MNTELDEVYVANIKEMFKEFDDEIIWSAIFEHGYQSNGDYNLENVVNYLLELSEVNIKKNKLEHGEVINTTNEKFIIPESNVDETTNLLNENNSKKNIENIENIENVENVEEDSTTTIYQNIVNFVSNKNGYQKLDNS